ncbi:unnamed protein product [marine sediment metagenome]|uniref:Uncharacterized protein n=1 Tax=marine sediment metagenome TaxID=412755 RepID=X1HPT3_9ZZZZ
MEDDLRYPERMVADEHWERPRSDLPVERGSMPGKPLQEVDEDNLISGRGLIP